MDNNFAILIHGGGGFENESGAGGTLALHGTLNDIGEIRLGEGYVGGAALLDIGRNGVLNNSGSLYLNGAFVFEQNSAGPTAPGSTLNDTGVLTNSGTIIFDGGGNGAGYGGGGAQLNVTGVLTNTGLIDMKGAYGNLPHTTALYALGTSGTLTVSGHGKATNSGQIVIEAANTYGYGSAATGSLLQTTGDSSFTNSGTITAGAGAADITGPAQPGTLSIDGLSFKDTGVIIAQGATVAGGAGGVVQSFTSLNITGTLEVASGTNGGGGGEAFLAGTVVLGLGAPGTLDVQAGSGSTGNGGGAGIFDTMLLGGQGTIDLHGGPSVGVFVVNPGGVFDDDGGAIIGAGAFSNYGTFITAANATVTEANFTNQGLVDCTQTLTLNAPVTNIFVGGTFDISAAGNLRLMESVGASQTVVFGANPGDTPTLSLGDASQFSGTLSGFGVTSTIDFLKLDVTGASTSGNVLTVALAGGGDINLALAAPLPGGTGFTLNSDGHGGTDLALAGAQPVAPAGGSGLSTPDLMGTFAEGMR